MRRSVVIACVCLALMASMAAQGKKSAKASGDAGQAVEQMERDWSKAMVSDLSGAVDKYEADDITSVDPTGNVTTKQQDKSDATSGNLKFESMDISDIKTRAYGNTAVALLQVSVKGKYKDQDISGNYRVTDTWVNRGGKWQVVASQATKITGQPGQ